MSRCATEASSLLSTLFLPHSPSSDCSHKLGSWFWPASPSKLYHSGLWSKTRSCNTKKSGRDFNQILANYREEIFLKEFTYMFIYGIEAEIHFAPQIPMDVVKLSNQFAAHWRNIIRVHKRVDMFTLQYVGVCYEQNNGLRHFI